VFNHHFEEDYEISSVASVLAGHVSQARIS